MRLIIIGSERYNDNSNFVLIKKNLLQLVTKAKPSVVIFMGEMCKKKITPKIISFKRNLMNLMKRHCDVIIQLCNNNIEYLKDFNEIDNRTIEKCSSFGIDVSKKINFIDIPKELTLRTFEHKIILIPDNENIISSLSKLRGKMTINEFFERNKNSLIIFNGKLSSWEYKIPIVSVSEKNNFIEIKDNFFTIGPLYDIDFCNNTKEDNDITCVALITNIIDSKFKYAKLDLGFPIYKTLNFNCKKLIQYLIDKNGKNEISTNKLLKQGNKYRFNISDLRKNIENFKKSEYYTPTNYEYIFNIEDNVIKRDYKYLNIDLSLLTENDLQYLN